MAKFSGRLQGRGARVACAKELLATGRFRTRPARQPNRVSRHGKHSTSKTGKWLCRNSMPVFGARLRNVRPEVTVGNIDTKMEHSTQRCSEQQPFQ